MQNALVTLKAQLQVKGASEKDYQMFATEASRMFSKLSEFMDRCYVLLAETSQMDMGTADPKLVAARDSLKAQAEHAASHKVGATAAIARFAAILGVANPSLSTASKK